MARAQQRGVNAVTISMIVFVILWLTATVFLVILYTEHEDIKRENEGLRATKNKFATRSEEQSLELVKQASERGPTVVGLFEEQRRTIAELATGNGEDDAATISNKRDELLDRIQNDGLVDKQAYADVSYHRLGELLYDDLKQTVAELNQADEQVQSLTDRVDQQSKALNDQQANFEQEVNKIKAKTDQAEQERVAFRKERSDAVARLETEFEQRRAQSEAELDEERDKRLSSEDALSKLQERYEEQQKKYGHVQIRPGELATARQPDGFILTAVPGDDMVYINLGRKDRLTLGLRFAVYSAETGIPPNGKGKGQIEVVAIFDSASECRIVETFGDQVIFENDLIANPIYDRDRPMTFLVLGEFDLNYDGRPDLNGAATIEAQITEWGGRLEEKVTALTDFVVVGAAPPRPKAIGDVSQEEADRMEAIRRVYDRYQNSLEIARSLSVPILTQSVFMNFLGY
ncbi:MAG: hypothetical protein JSV78_12705 [Phycisphaerales bacterium]|nr:MAG: hypothetical protein JSV78_12705 [Phycisphaerales bacterium]